MKKQDAHAIEQITRQHVKSSVVDILNAFRVECMKQHNANPMGCGDEKENMLYNIIEEVENL